MVVPTITWTTLHASGRTSAAREIEMTLFEISVNLP
jgi:hypothetical protein